MVDTDGGQANYSSDRQTLSVNWQIYSGVVEGS